MAEDKFLLLIRKYEEARQLNKSIYLDADQFSELAEYYDTIEEIDTARDVIRLALKIHPQSTSLIAKKAKFLTYEAKYTEALELLSSYDDSDFYLIKAECYINLNLEAEAAYFIKELIENEDPEDLGELFSQIGNFYIDVDSYDKAIPYLKKSLEYNLDDIDGLYDLAYAYEMVNNYDEAVKCFDKALSLDSSDKETWVRVSKLYSELAYTYETANRYEDAIRCFDKILDINPYDSESWIQIGKLYSQIGDYAKAIDAFDFAIATTKGQPEYSVLKLKAHCLSLIGRYTEAITLFEKLIELTPEDTLLHFLLCECYQENGLYDEALKELDKAASTEGGIAGVDYIAKKVQIMLQQDRSEEAINLVDTAIILEKDSIDLHVIASEIKLRQEKIEEAEAYLNKVIKGNEDEFLIVNMQSIIAIKKEAFDDAIEMTEKLLALDENNIEARQRLALLYFEVNDEELFNQILEEFTDQELLRLFSFIYAPSVANEFNRDELVFYLNEARERRTLFKNLQF